MKTIITSIKNISYLALVFSIVFISSCSDDDSPMLPSDDENYSYLVAPALESADLYPMHPVTTLQSGSASIYDAQEIPDAPWNVLVNGKDGFVYLNYDGVLSKYSVDGQGVLKSEGAILGLGISGGPLSAFTNDTEMLVSTGMRANETGVFSYQVIDTDGMTELSTGNFTVQLGSGERASLSGYIYKDGKIFVPYIHYDAKWSSLPFAPLQVYDAATLQLEKTIKDDRTAGLGLSVVSSHGIDESGNLYLISCPSNYWGANESLPSGLLRINAGEDDFDSNYFLDLSSKFNGNHTAGFLYVGNNKAIVQVFRSDLIEEYSDYQWDFNIEYYVVDVVSGETEKLNIPLAMYPRNAMTITRDGKGAIAATTANGSAMYIYDATTGTLSTGLTYSDVDYIEGVVSFR
ncbi:DUF4374 domain-containing protein [Flammeovirgaceae bacterium SG7u.111]|nr:DUF4374 domain-containing protein [Flammeovirgaceae bacterium SG7u.132]WPO33394.1 DUF4374 domain-containing protein [Flammeovirgaceae bacterium SG7u.111]